MWITLFAVSDYSAKVDQGWKLISIAKELPLGSKFKQWSAMNRYWKNMYEYRLDEVFYDISFWGGRSVLTLP